MASSFQSPSPIDSNSWPILPSWTSSMLNFNFSNFWIVCFLSLGVIDRCDSKSIISSGSTSDWFRDPSFDLYDDSLHRDFSYHNELDYTNRLDQDEISGGVKHDYPLYDEWPIEGHLDRAYPVNPNLYEDYEQDKKIKKFWKNLGKKGKASIILGTFGFLTSVGLYRAVGETLTVTTTTEATTTTTASTNSQTPTTSTSMTTDTTASTATTSTTTMSTTSRTRPTSPTPTMRTTVVVFRLPGATTTTTTSASSVEIETEIPQITTSQPTTVTIAETSTQPSASSVPCYKTTASTGTYATHPNTPESLHPAEQCLAVTVPIGQRIQLTCASVFSSPGTFVVLYDMNGKNVLANKPVGGQTYTTADNTLIVKSLTSGRHHEDQLYCQWDTIVAFKNVYFSKSF